VRFGRTQDVGEEDPMTTLQGTSAPSEDEAGPAGPVAVEFRADPATYRHWRLRIEPPVAVLAMDVDEAGGLVPGYELKLNSYDLGVDIELYDAVQRLRFEHPEVAAVILTSAKDRVFCAGANIHMLATSAHAWKVNFCKFTNETRNGIEDAGAVSGQRYLAALNGTASGGGYELALACERILLVDDGSSAVSLPEVPLLAVLPGTGGLTRLVDKRHVARDRADVFATKAEGLAGRKALDWGLVDELAPKSRWDETVAARASELAAESSRPADAAGIVLTPLAKERDDRRIAYRHVHAVLDHQGGVATITVAGPTADPPADPAGLVSAGDVTWALAMTRELDDLVLDLRTNETRLGTWVLRTTGDPAAVLAHDRFLAEHADHWLVNEVSQYLKRTLKRLDVTSRSLLALVEPESCFAGSLLELALAADRSYQLAGVPEGSAAGTGPATVTVGPLNLGPLPMGNGLTRLESRYFGRPDALEAVLERAGEALEADEALDLGLVTAAPDDLDWEDEVRLAVEERASFSPDALSGMEANLRFVGPETTETKIFARLSAWQNWVFVRPNASGAQGALRQYGTGQRATFDPGRV
jgi:benzoyl-CoA-dihydrodiol lyase